MTEENSLPEPIQNDQISETTSKIDSEIRSPDTSSMNQYLFFLGGQFISLLGSSVVQFAIIWWITITYESALYLAIASFLGFGPTLIVGLFAGVFVDRWNRKKVLAYVDSMEALASMVLVGLFYFDMVKIWHIFVILTIRAFFQGFHQPAIQAIIPLMVPREKLTRVNSLEYMSNSLIFMIGPVVAAVLIGLVGLNNIHLIILIDMGTFLVALIPLIFIKIPRIIKRMKPSGEQPSFREDFSEGFVFIKQKPGLLSLLSIFTVTNFFSMPLFVLAPLIVAKPDLLNGSESTLAFGFVALQGMGFLAGLLMAKGNPFSKNTTGVFTGIFIGNTGIFVVFLGAMWGSIPLFLVGMGLFGLTTPIANVCSQNIWQVVVPPELMGRVFSVRRTIAQISSPAAMIMTGFVAEGYGILNVLFACVILQLVMIVYIWTFTQFRNVEQRIGISDPLAPEQETPQVPSETPAP